MINHQGFECKVLSPYLSSKMDTFIPYIFMEWMHVRVNLDNNCPDLAGLVDLFDSNAMDISPWILPQKGF